MTTHSDTGCFVDDEGFHPHGKKEDKKDNLNSQTKTNTGTTQGASGGASTNKSTPTTQNSAQRPVVINVTRPAYTPIYTVPGPKKTVHSTYNFQNSRIINAALDRDGPTTFNNDYTTYKDGAVNQDIKISGGKFNQTNIGGKATFHNEGSTISSGSGGGAKLPNTGFVDIDKYPHPYAPEEYLAKLLRTGITSEELINLLENKYSIVNLAYSIPASNKREAMIDALLKVADMEQMDH